VGWVVGSGEGEWGFGVMGAGGDGGVKGGFDSLSLAG